MPAKSVNELKNYFFSLLPELAVYHEDGEKRLIEELTKWAFSKCKTEEERMTTAQNLFVVGTLIGKHGAALKFQKV